MSVNTFAFDDDGNVTLYDVQKEVFDPALQIVSDARKDIQNELVDPARKLIDDTRGLLTPKGIFGIISKSGGSSAPVFPLVDVQYRPGNRDFKCPQEGACPEGYTCIKRDGQGRCYQMRWNRNH